MTIRPLGLARGIVFVGALAVFPLLAHANWVVNIGVFTIMYAALATAWNLFSGYSGYISLGHVAFFGIGAYTLAIVLDHWHVGGYVPFYLLPLIGVGTALVALPLGRIALRVRAMTFAIVTLTTLFVFQQLAFNVRSLTHGSSGYSLPLPTFSVGTYERPFYMAMLGVLVLGLLLSWHIRHSKLGLMLLSIREDEEKARGLGVRTTGAKLITFALSAGLTAMVGAIWAYYIGYIYPEYSVDPLVMVGSVLPVFLGGRATLWGPVLGALILVPAQQYMAYRLGASQLYLVGYAAVFVAILLVLPRGILPSIRDAFDRWRFRTRRSSLAGVSAEPTAAGRRAT
ncbi:MAG TPA: branched-chain amino acid ABC transporter permease [Gaiellaceae bacterium]|nr:branched-chain amino acid ABC transporter permease [Gaiellaceae bacterium]